LDFWNGFGFGWDLMGVAVVVVFGGCEIGVGLVVVGSAWF